MRGDSMREAAQRVAAVPVGQRRKELTAVRDLG